MYFSKQVDMRQQTMNIEALFMRERPTLGLANEDTRVSGRILEGNDKRVEAPLAGDARSGASLQIDPRDYILLMYAGNSASQGSQQAV